MSDPKHLLVMGATKGIGYETTEAALDAGHRVRALARSADDMDARDGLERFAGDALAPEDMARALVDIDAVIFALGIEESLSMLWEEVTLFSEATKVLLDQMPKAGVNRLIAVTGFGAGRSKNAMSWIERTGHRAILGKPYADKDRQEALITSSDLDYTIVRPVILRNSGKSKSYKVMTEPSDWRNGLISRADVADYCVRAAAEHLHSRQDVVLSR